ncbi:MAG: TonB-dependent receptor [Candidatus Competibacteraceae bacterium]|jgi:outer membrane receptor protein involved in Fe transport|nr:TonB-dependent receptor [Candidatus Competibacteraceae bacterium]
MSKQTRKIYLNGVKPLTAAVSAALIAGTAFPALSQDAPSRARSLVLEEVVVTAQKREQSINDIPMAITAFSGDSMQEMGIQDTADLALIVPGFAFSESQAGAPVYTLRGIGFNEQSTQATSTVGVYVDEIAIPFPIMTRGAMLDVERVEVLKGPQGTLYGRNSTGGAVNYIANKPTEEFESRISTTYGRFDTLNVDGFVSGSITDNVQARLAAKVVNSSEGWQESVTRDDDLGEQDKLALRLSLAAQLGDNTDVAFNLGYWKDESDTIAPQFVEFTNPQDPDNSDALSQVLLAYLPDQPLDDAQDADWTQNGNQRFDMENTSVSLQIAHAINDSITFKSLTGYAEFEENGSTYERGGIQGIPASDVPDAYKSGRITGQSTGFFFNDGYEAFNDIDSITQEFRLTGEYDNVTWITGVYYSNSTVDNRNIQIQEADSATAFGPAPFLNFTGSENFGSQETTTYAVFASADWTLTDNLVVTTGLRYTEDEADFTGCSADPGPGDLADFLNVVLAAVDPQAQAGECVTLNESFKSAEHSDTLKEDSISWRLAADYSFTDDTSAYISYSRGFKSGSFPTLGALNASQFAPAVQEQLDAYELGFKSTLADGAAQLNGSVFYYDYTDKQLLTKIPDVIFGSLFAVRNADSSTVVGAELDLQWVPVQGLTIAGGISYLDTEISSFEGTSQRLQFTNFEGSELPFSSRIQASGTAKYEWSVGDNLMANIALDVSYTDDSNADFESSEPTYNTLPDGSGEELPYVFDENFRIDGYTLVNARIGISDAGSKWATYLWARNLTDELYVTNVVQQSDSVARYVGMPRTYGVTLDYSF